MIKRFWKDNRGQVLYAVIVAVMFLGVLSMIAMGLTLQHYHAAVKKQENVTHYYAADAAAELLRIGQSKQVVQDTWDVQIEESDGVYVITSGTVTITTQIENRKYVSWEVSYHAGNTEADTNQSAP